MENIKRLHCGNSEQHKPHTCDCAVTQHWCDGQPPTEVVRVGQYVVIVAGEYGVGQVGRVAAVDGDSIAVMLTGNLGLWYNQDQARAV